MVFDTVTVFCFVLCLIKWDLFLLGLLSTAVIQIIMNYRVDVVICN